MSTDVLVILHNNRPWIEVCLSALSGLGSTTVTLVDNCSSDDSLALAKRLFPDVGALRLPQNRGFGGGVNSGMRLARGDIVLVLNPDVRVELKTHSSLRDAMNDPRVAIAGCKLLYPNGTTIQHAGGKITYPLALADHFGYGEEDRGQYDEPSEVDYVTGALFAIRKSVLEEIGYFDEGFFPAYFEEADLCYRARKAGYKVLYVPDAVAIHHESVTTGKETYSYFHFYHRNRLRFVLKHWTVEQFARDFFPAEAGRLSCLTSPVEVQALADAYVDNVAVLEGKAEFFANPSAVAPIAPDVVRLKLLRALAEQARGRVERLSVGHEEPRSMPQEPSETFQRLKTRAQVVEPEFKSVLPLLGSSLVAVRRAWNWMSTKWYVRQVIEQQNAFNAAVVEVVSELAGVLDGQARRLDTWEESAVRSERGFVGLTRDVALLEARIQRIEDRLEHIEELLRSLAKSDGAREKL